MKYKPVYKVTIGETEIGYVKNKSKFQATLTKTMKEQDESIAFVELNEIPQFELKFVENGEETSEQELMKKAEENIEPVYTMYGIALNGDVKVNVASEKEAQEIVTQLEEKYQEIDVDLQIKQAYLKEKPEIISQEVAIATLENNNIQVLVDQKEEEENKSVIVAARPLSGTITSRYGVKSRIRSGAHTGLDIAAKKGTPIVACNSGTVKFSGKKGSYGFLIIIDHGNGVESWYGHCSKLYVSAGQKVKAGQKIAAVGSTGNSTGPHLHFEIRINGKTVNPQNYL